MMPGVLFEGLGNVPLATAEPDFRRIQSHLERVIADSTALSESPVSVRILGSTTLAYCRERLGDWQGAMRAFDAALKLDPSSDALRVARGLVLVRHDMESAAHEFREAVHLKSRLFHPYLFLAPYALGKGDWAAALDFATTLLARTQNPSIEAEARQWQAIAVFELGKPWSEVEGFFQEANRLDPLNIRIRENHALCRKARLVEERRVVQWSRPGPQEFPDPISFWPLAEAA